MPAGQKKEQKINLLPREEFASSTLGRIFTWALYSFRVIVILVEGIVMIAFLSRFWLDAKASDLNDTIKQKKAIVQAEMPFEKKFKGIQTKLQIVKDLRSGQYSTPDLLKTISENLPPDVHLVNFTFDESSLQIKGLSASERSIQQFISNLENSNKFKDVFLLSANADSENKVLLLFSLKMTVTPQKGGGK